MFKIYENITHLINKPKMTLSRETKLGMTFGQVIAITSVLIVLFGVGLQANIRMSRIEIDQNAATLRIEQLEKGRLQNADNIETIRKENREDHQEIIRKIDALILRNDRIDKK